MQGKITKSIAGFYEVLTPEGMFRCRARGALRTLGIKPLVGDDAEIEITDTVSIPPEGSVIRILPRRNDLIRPSAANVDQALLLFAIVYPVPSFNMLDRFLITMAQKNLPAILCFNKEDLAREEDIEQLRKAYADCGCRIFFISTKKPETLDPLKEALAGKTTVITGPSGAGKSSTINCLCSHLQLETGELSRKIARGKNTTRTVELYNAGEDTWLMDTPGFTSLFLMDTEADELKEYYPEFSSRSGKCRFSGCAHMSEPDCAVREAAESGEISPIRYENYRELYLELKDRRPDYRKIEKRSGK